MQTAVIDYARNACRLQGANSREFDASTRYPVIDFMPGQYDDIDKGGTLRLGKYPCELREGTVIRKCYGQASISERHRHRYELNNDFRAELVAAGLCLSGLSPDGRLVETIEIPGEVFYVGVQFHPEFKSRPNRPHPLFVGFVKASMKV
jgi:CTP synthase